MWNLAFLCADLANREFHSVPVIQLDPDRNEQTQQRVRHSNATHPPFAIQQTARAVL
jgi:hypothetical protein